MDRLRQRLEDGLSPRELDGAARVAPPLRLGGERLEHTQRPLTVLRARLDRPVVVDAREERPLEQRERLVAAPGGREPVRLERVDPGVGEADAVARGDERVVAEASAERPERAAQAGPGALVEHVRPEPRRNGGSPVDARVEREPREHRARPAGRERTPLASDLRADVADQAHAKHRQRVRSEH
jgi:hypothetical protein